ncbi:MAG: monovalent cation/H(+) antiporter subunit G [Candidatus Promineifilaceae bacterium]|nr:monovalent cation/H(+) antiporter subunit G [Candidatus Promineifilaceae bacterium]
MTEIVAIVLVLLGTVFSVLGVFGFYRLPDVYTRLHATGKVGVLGVVLLLLAAAVVIPQAWSKVLVLVLLMVVVGPVTAHTLSSAAHRLDVEMKDAQRNDLLNEVHEK